TREDVRELADVAPGMAARMRFVAQALRPAETTQTWRSFRESQSPAQLASALEGVSVFEAADEREEALALAVALRETLETPGATAALITPDRNLARRVRAELARWDIDIDDSGGEPLANSPHGVLARLTLACAAPSCAAAPLLALLRHPLTRLGYDAREASRRVDLAEIGLLRGLRPDLTDIDAALEIARARRDDMHAHRTLKAFREADFDDVRDLLGRLHAALAPLRAMPPGASVRQWAHAHGLAVAAIAQAPEGAREHTGLDAGAFALMMDDFAHSHDMKFPFAAADYEVFFEACAREAVVRSVRANHPRIKSLGLLEARLIDVDVALLGGLDEAIWPPAARTDAFLSRPMRAELGLSPPERRIGQTAHDFVQALGARRVVISRALKRGGAPTTPSRFLQRLEALGGEAWRERGARGARYLELARLLDAPRETRPIKRPEPRPDLALRPMQLSVTRIETLRRDPYAIYAERVLRLAPLDGLDLEEGVREAGTRLHGVLAKFQKAHPRGPLPAHAAQEIEAIARADYANDLRDPEFRAFHWPRVQANLAAFLAWDGERRDDIDEVLAEQSGDLRIALRDGSEFKLTGTADRIERRTDGAYAVVDFKTGAPPSTRVVNCGMAPQLTLEARMISHGAFVEIPPGAQVASALYVRLGGKDDVETREATGKEPLADAVLSHYEGLVTLLDEFRDPATAYVPRTYPQFITYAGPYDHLSRYREWSTGGGEGE
ncbi:MAG: double-strand break repair protein AddB, partial [Hyphomicrobiales bacterium]|nr:double-strand break repair protein AddB [Hyphomicrobiales bacterium]